MSIKELSRFSNNGKTFFFNQGRAKTDSDFLAVNTLYGQGQRERLVLFPSHLLEFRKHLDAAIEALTGFSPAGPKESQTPPSQMPIQCPSCGVGYHKYRISPSANAWVIFCEPCGETIYEPR